MKLKKYIPNIISSFRIFGALAIIITPMFSIPFFIIYSLCGLSDTIDGYLARKFNAISKLGSLLDTIGDLMFYGITLLKIIPFLVGRIPNVIWVIVAAIIIIRALVYLIVALKFHKFSSTHTLANKVSGLAVFTLPYIAYFANPTYICLAICIITGFATLQELYTHLISNEYIINNESLLTTIERKEKSIDKKNTLD